MHKLLTGIALSICVSAVFAGETPLLQDRNEEVWATSIVEVPDFDNIADVCEALGAEANATYSNVGGCNSFNTATKRCVIYVHAPRYLEDYKRFAILGHELWHCKHGRFHS